MYNCFVGPPPLSIRENFDGESPNSSPLWHLNQSGSSINTSCSSNGIQNSPCLKGASASPHLPSSHPHQSLRHHSLTSPTSISSQNSISDLNQHQKGSVNSRGINNTGTNMPSPMHQTKQSSHHRADHFTFSPNHISAESSASSISYIGHGGNAQYPYNENFITSPVPSATSPPCIMPVNLGSPARLGKNQFIPSHGQKGPQQPRVPPHSQHATYSASSPIKNSTASRDNK